MVFGVEPNWLKFTPFSFGEKMGCCLAVLFENFRCIVLTSGSVLNYCEQSVCTFPRRESLLRSFLNFFDLFSLVTVWKGSFWCGESAAPPLPGFGVSLRGSLLLRFERRFSVQFQGRCLCDLGYVVRVSSSVDVDIDCVVGVRVNHFVGTSVIAFDFCEAFYAGDPGE